MCSQLRENNKKKERKEKFFYVFRQTKSTKFYTKKKKKKLLPHVWINKTIHATCLFTHILPKKEIQYIPSYFLPFFIKQEKIIYTFTPI